MKPGCNTHTANKQVKDVTLTVGDDPTNTAHIREGFIRELQRRFSRLRGLVRKTVGYENDAFDLSANDETDGETQEDFPTGKTLGAAAFMTWLKKTINSVIFNPLPIPKVKAGEHWTARFLDQAAIKGFNQGTGILMQKGVSIENTPNDQILSIPRVRMALQGTDGNYQRAYFNLAEITEDLESDVRDILVEGFNNGWNPRRMADELTREIRAIERERAVTLARTETIRAHTDAALANYERNGVDVVGHVSRFVTPDNALCSFCRRLRDTPFTMSEFRNVVVEWRNKPYRVGIPSHPNGRCAPDPVVDMGNSSLDSLEERLSRALGKHTILTQ
jgi:hypothetical protein